MTDKMGRKDEQLIESLRQKLDWYTYEATEEEFDEKQVQMIVSLLDELDPPPEAKIKPDGSIVYGSDTGDAADDAVSLYDAQAALKRFQQKYHISDEELHEKKIVPMGRRKGAGPRQNRRFVQIAAAACAALFLLVLGGGIFGLRGSADRQHSFFDFIQEGLRHRSVTITGDDRETTEFTEVGDSTRNHFASWEEIAAQYDLIKVPRYIPDGATLQELYGEEYEIYTTFRGVYQCESAENLSYIEIRYYSENYGKVGFPKQENWRLIEEDEDDHLQVYQADDMFYAVLLEGRCYYYISWNDLNELKRILDGIE